jgi:hypothetical protein
MTRRGIVLTSDYTIYAGDSLVQVAEVGTISDPAQVLAMLDPAIDLAA